MYKTSIDLPVELREEAIGLQQGRLADTADLFTGVSREIDKQLWFVEAHLQAER